MYKVTLHYADIEMFMFSLMHVSSLDLHEHGYKFRAKQIGIFQS